MALALRPETTQSSLCPHHVPAPVMNHDWERLSFVHRRVDVGALQRRLPAGLTLDLHDGDAWVGLVLFELRVAPTMIGAVPRAGVFGEVNVRTYVLGPDGTPGIWFLSLDAPSLSAVVVARRWYGLPYHWSAVSTVAAGDAVSYGCTRHGTGRRVHGSVAVEIGAPVDAASMSALDEFLTARWRLYAARRGRLVYADVEHTPWPLHRARLTGLDETLLIEAGVVGIDDEPVVHYSPAVRAHLGAPHLAPLTRLL